MASERNIFAHYLFVKFPHYWYLLSVWLMLNANWQPNIRLFILAAQYACKYISCQLNSFSLLSSYLCAWYRWTMWVCVCVCVSNAILMRNTPYTYVTLSVFDIIWQTCVLCCLIANIILCGHSRSPFTSKFATWFGVGVLFQWWIVSNAIFSHHTLIYAQMWNIHKQTNKRTTER